MRCKDGSIIWMHDTARYDRENDCFYVTVMDITEAKSLEYENKKLGTYLRHMPNKIVIFDTSGRIVYQNNAAQNCPYFSNEAEHIEQLVGPYILGTRFSKLMEHAFQGTVVEYETRFSWQGAVTGHDKNYIVPVQRCERKYS